MKLTYTQIRILYYTGIFLIALYAFPNVSFVQKYLYPIFEFEPIVGVPVISIISIASLGGAYMAFKYRTIG